MSPQQLLANSRLKELGRIELLKELWWKAEFVKLHKGDKLFELGEPSDGSFYMVVSGELSVNFVRSDGSEDSKPKGPGELCGESGIVLEGQRRTATVVVLSEEVQLLRWSNAPVLLAKPEFRKLRQFFESVAGDYWVETSIRTT